MQAHLDLCRECRRFCRQMTELIETLDDLRAASERPASPVKPTRWIRRTGPRLAKAAAILIIVGAAIYVALWHRPSDGKRTANVSTDARTIAESTTAPVEKQKAFVELTGESADAFLAVEQPTRQPRVHLFVLYPTVRNQSPKHNL